MTDMVVTFFPCTMYYLFVPVLFFFIKMISPIGCNGHCIGGTIRQPYACMSQCHLGHVMCKITYRMIHFLVACCNAGRSSIIISAKMHCYTTTPGCFYKSHEWIDTLSIHDGLSCFHHH